VACSFDLLYGIAPLVSYAMLLNENLSWVGLDVARCCYLLKNQENSKTSCPYHKLMQKISLIKYFSGPKEIF